MYPHHAHISHVLTSQPALTRRRARGTVGALAAATFLLSGVSSATAAQAPAAQAPAAQSSAAQSSAVQATALTSAAASSATTAATTFATTAATVTVAAKAKTTATAKAKAKARAKAKRLATIRAFNAKVKKMAKRYPRAAARKMMRARGYSKYQQDAVIKLWNKESNWRWWADNPSSSAYGIPQALPGSKMASAGRDWRTNPVTQIRWGLKYIKDRYGKPSNAWAHSQRRGWY